MAIIHRTTLTPGKLELLAGWLPLQPWYAVGGSPELRKAGGFRLDDPAGEVGLEFMIVTDRSGDDVVAYQAPMSYRATPLAEAEHALIGTTEHGVLGHRWVYDGAQDPVLVGRLFDLLQGRTQPQAQSESNTPDLTVTVESLGGEPLSVRGMAVAGGRGQSSDIAIQATGGADPTQPMVIRLIRRLQPDDDTSGPDPHRASVTAGWNLPDGSAARGRIAFIE